MATEEKCSIGAKLQLSCSGQETFKYRASYLPRDVYLIELRSGAHIETVCEVHDLRYGASYGLHQRSCCNPFNIPDHLSTKSLYSVTPELHDACQSDNLVKVIEGRKLCISCKKRVLSRLRKEQAPASPASASPPVLHPADDAVAGPSGARAPTPLIPIADTDSGTPGSSSSKEGSSGETCSPKKVVLEKLNETIKSLPGISPITERKFFRSAEYAEKKETQAVSVLRKSFKKATQHNEKHVSSVSSEVDYESIGKEFIERLTEKFVSESSYSRKIQILSLAPSTWSINKIMMEFGASRHIVKKMRQLVQEEGILCEVNRKISRPMPAEITEKVMDFYREPDVSREMPGAKEFVSVKTQAGKEHKQKRLVLGNLKEIYVQFKERHPDVNIGFSKFAELRPKECVLAGASGTHVVCVCCYHQNMKLMFEGGQLGKVKGEDGAILFSTYRDLLLEPLCDPPTENCFFGLCSDCPALDKIRGVLERYYQDNFIEDVTYNRWTTVDRSSLEVLTKSTDDFIGALLESIPQVVQHDYISKKQSEYYKLRRDNLQEGEVLVVADFSENYSFVLQNGTQGVHWNNAQATVFPFACYIKVKNQEKPQPLNLVIISDYMNHSTTAVYAFQHRLVAFLKNYVPNMKKIMYFSDGAASQFKNRFNMVNLLQHEEDFGVPAEWHYFATSHGKGPSDGLGGTTKRLAARASLQLPPEDQIQTPRQFFSWVTQNITGINFAFVAAEDMKDIEKAQKRRFRNAPSVSGIRSFHAAVPQSRDSLAMRITSLSPSSTLHTLRDTGGEDDEENIDEPTQPVTRCDIFPIKVSHVMRIFQSK